jgi:hypothetical protein
MAQNVTGPYTNFVTTSALIVNDQSFSGNVVNSGTINPGDPTGIRVENGASITGTITNAGTIDVTSAGAVAILVGSELGPDSSVVTDAIFNGLAGHVTGANGVLVDFVSSFGGGIVNVGTVHAVSTGIGPQFDSTIDGGITNVGWITGTNEYNLFAYHDSVFSGGITNTGTLFEQSGGGIDVFDPSTFNGSINNSGTITGRIGINVAASTIDGAIVDSGDINAGGFGDTAISVDQFSAIDPTTGAGIAINGPTFLGGLTNAGAISAPAEGIFVGGTTGAGAENVSTFSGGITNSGAITAAYGLLIGDVGSFAGSIVNSAGGAIQARSTGIYVGNVGSLGFSGGITNSAVISATGGYGILVTSVATAADATFGSGLQLHRPQNRAARHCVHVRRHHV